MKKLWTVKMSILNGTVTMHTDISNYTDEALAKKVADTLSEKNKKSSEFEVFVEVEETSLYESEEEVPILNLKEGEG